MESYSFCGGFHLTPSKNSAILRMQNQNWYIWKKFDGKARIELERPVSTESVNVHLMLFKSTGKYSHWNGPEYWEELTKNVTIPKDQKKIQILDSTINQNSSLKGIVFVSVVDSFKIDGSQLSEDFAHLLDSDDSSDFVLRCDGQEFRVHKCILAARCSVFAAMFSFHNKTVKSQDPSFAYAVTPNAKSMKGKGVKGQKRKKCEDSIQETSMACNQTEYNAEDIVDMKPEILKKMLKYIYCGRIDDLTSTEAVDLLYGADKYYQLKLLKEMCVEKLKSTLSPRNVFDILVIGDLHDQSLKAHAMEFICKYPSSEMKKMDKWKSLQTTHPTLVAEVLTFVLGFLPESSSNKHK